MRLKNVIILVTLLVTSQNSFSFDEKTLEAKLINALRLNSNTQERIGDSGAAIQAYVKEGYLNKKPNGRFDYTDYCLLKKPASFMGHSLVVIEEEYVSRYIGCCVSPGMDVTVKVSGSTDNLEKFAKKNGCRFDGDADPQSDFKDFRIKVILPKAKYVSLSCRERDLEQ